MSSGDTTPAITAPRSTLHSRRSRRTTSRGCASPGDGLSSTPRCSKQNPQLRPANNFRSTPIMVGGVLYASNGIGLVEAFDPATGRTIWVQQVPESELPVGSSQSRRRVLEPGRQRTHPDVPQPVPLRAGRPHRNTGRGVRYRRPCRSHGRHGRLARLQVERDAARGPRRGGSGIVDGRAGLGRPHDRRAGRCLRLRRADRDSCGGRSVRFHVPASPASRPGRTSRGATPAPRTSGRR